MATFHSHGRHITIELLYPQDSAHSETGPSHREALQPVAAEATHPAVMVVHGSGGGHSSINQYSPMLARFGYAVFVVRYFESTGTRFASPSATRQHFKTWVQTLGDAVDFMGAQPAVDNQRIGLLGLSLGGYLSMALASTDRRVKSVVNIFGGFPEPYATAVTAMPPTLILHGDADPVVPVSEAYKADEILKKINASHEIKVYPGLGHAFDPVHAVDASQRILSFFSRYLKGATVSSPAK